MATFNLVLTKWLKNNKGLTGAKCQVAQKIIHIYPCLSLKNGFKMVLSKLLLKYRA